MKELIVQVVTNSQPFIHDNNKTLHRQLFLCKTFLSGQKIEVDDYELKSFCIVLRQRSDKNQYVFCRKIS